MKCELCEQEVEVVGNTTKHYEGKVKGTTAFDPPKEIGFFIELVPNYWRMR